MKQGKFGEGIANTPHMDAVFDHPVCRSNSQGGDCSLWVLPKSGIE